MNVRQTWRGKFLLLRHICQQKKPCAGRIFLPRRARKTCVRVLRELKMDNDTIDKAKILSRFAFTQMEPEESAVRHAMSAMEDTVFDWLLLLQEVLMPERMDAVEMVRSLASQIRERGDCIRLKTLAVTGKDLIQAGIQPGPALGKTLHTSL